MMASPAGGRPAEIDFRVRGEGREYLKKLMVPIVIVGLLLFIFAYALASYGPDYLIERLVAMSYLVLGMIVGAIFLLVLLRVYVRLRFVTHVVSYNIKASRQNLPEIYGIAETAAGRLGMRPPGVYVVQDPAINAYAMGLRRKIVVINTGLIDATDRDELTFIVGHELTHVRYGWAIPVRLFGITVPLPMLLGSRQREYTCDRGGLIACRDLDKAVLALAKLALGKGLADKIDVGRLYTSKEEAEADRISRLSEALATHPPIRDRVLQLREFYGSALYKELVR